MTKPYLKRRRYALKPLCVLIISLVINGCKKDGHAGDGAPQGLVVSGARAWYEKAYPLNSGGKSSLSVGTGRFARFDFSQFITPYWEKAQSYPRLGNEVVEVPIDPKDTFSMELTDDKGRPFCPGTALSRTSFLLLNDAKGYRAFIMNITADSAYLGGDRSKLDRNRYQSHDPHFSGSVVYYTPTGGLVSGWIYKNGAIVYRITNEAMGNKSRAAVRSKGTNRLTLWEECTDWYTVVDNVKYYSSTTCTYHYEDDGLYLTGGEYNPWTTNSTGGTPISSPSAPCYPVYTPPADGGYPEPDHGTTQTGVNTCTTTTQQVTEVEEAAKINTDSLKAKFPCAVKLIVDSLLRITDYHKFVEPFVSGTNSNIAIISWDTKLLDWNATSSQKYMLGETEVKNNELSAKVYLNTKMLQNSSQLLIAGTSIHETLHAYINYNIQTAYYSYKDSTMSLGSWMYGLDSWYALKGLPSNFTNHYEMLDHYFNLAVNALAAWDKNNHTIQDYRMIMLFGLDNADLPVTTQNQVRISLLTKEYNDLLTKYGITQTNLKTYWLSQLNAGINSKLPTSGCN